MKEDKIILENIYNQIRSGKILEESGFPRIASIMRGVFPRVRTFAMLTAENPKGEPATPEYNEAANLELAKKLRSMNLGFKKIFGKYGQIENSFFVPNITKDEAMDIGRGSDPNHAQDSIIFGERIDGEGEYDGMKISMIYTNEKRYGEIAGVRYVFINVENADDYYSEYKGKKFKIPFFDEPFKGKDGKEYVKSYDNAKFGNKSGLMHGVEVKEMLDEETVTRIEFDLDQIIYENKTAKFRYFRRGFINNEINIAIGLND